MQSVFAVVLLFAVAANAGLLLQNPIQFQNPIVRVHAPVSQVVVPAATSHSYKIRAPAAKIVTHQVVSSPVLHASPVHTYSAGLPLVHHQGVLLH